MKIKIKYLKPRSIFVQIVIPLIFALIITTLLISDSIKMGFFQLFKSNVLLISLYIIMGLFFCYILIHNILNWKKEVYLEKLLDNVVNYEIIDRPIENIK